LNPTDEHPADKIPKVGGKEIKKIILNLRTRKKTLVGGVQNRKRLKGGRKKGGGRWGQVSGSHEGGGFGREGKKPKHYLSALIASSNEPEEQIIKNIFAFQLIEGGGG